MFLCARIRLAYSDRKFPEEFKNASLTTVSVEMKPQWPLEESALHRLNPAT